MECRDDLAHLYMESGRYDQAAAIYKEYYARLQRDRGAKYDSAAQILRIDELLAHIYEEQSRYAEAEAYRNECLAFQLLLDGPNTHGTIMAQYNLARLHRKCGKPALAEPVLLDIVRRLKASPKIDDPSFAIKELISVYEETAPVKEAAATRTNLLADWKREYADDPGSYATSLAGYGLELLRARKWNAAETVLRECVSIREQEEPDEWTTFNTKSLLGGALLGQRRYAEAEPLLLAGYEGMKRREATIPANSKAPLPEALDRLIWIGDVTGKVGESTRWRLDRANYPLEKAPRPRHVK